MTRSTGSVLVLAAVAVPAAAEPPPRYRIFDLTELAAPLGVAQCEARAVNEAGEIVGFEVVGLAESRAIRWDANLAPSLPPSLPGDNSTIAWGVTGAGNAIGASEHVTYEKIGHIIHIHIDAKAVVWEAAQPVTLASLVTGGPPMSLRAAAAVNDSGQIVGPADIPGQLPSALELKGFLLDHRLVTDLGVLTGPTDISNTGTIVGHTRFGQSRAHKWAAGVATSLHVAPLAGVSSAAWGVNDAGLIVGNAQFFLFSAEEPCLWQNGTPTRLVPQFTRVQGDATAVNNRGQIVGFYINLDNLNDHWHGFLWQDGVRHELTDLIPPGEGWQQLYPFAINDRGVIVGGALRNNTFGHGFAMRPVCYPDCDQSGALSVADYICFQTRFALGDPYADCDGNGVRNVGDYICFQTGFALGC